MNAKLRWRIVLPITAAIAVSYFNRQTLTVAVTKSQQPWVSLAYARCWTKAGRKVCRK
jgi:hypothetical protein